jgi:hypothetical protein
MFAVLAIAVGGVVVAVSAGPQQIGLQRRDGPQRHPSVEQPAPRSDGSVASSFPAHNKPSSTPHQARRTR